MASLVTTLLTAAGWTVLHLLWQAVAITLLYAVVCRTLALKSRARYRLGLATMSTLLALACATGIAALTVPATRAARVESRPPTTAVQAASTEAPSHHVEPQTSTPARTWLRDERVLQVIGAGWLVLVVFSAGAVFGARALLLRRSRAALPLPPGLEPAIEALLARLGLHQPVRVLQARVPQPLLFGTRRPIVLLPTALVDDLSPAHLAAVLAHEFAHVCRRDYLMNLAQVTAENLLARHPAVLWLSREIRRDRELCCDALAARAVGSRRVVAEALAQLEQRRSGPFQLAPAATEGDLVQRVRRLLQPAERPPRRARPRIHSLAGGFALALVPLLALPVTLPSPVPDSVSVAPRLVLGGVDPVALLQREERTIGLPDHERVHEGRLYHFASADNANAFAADPQAYAVVNVDLCPVTGEPVLSDVFEVVDGRIYLFCCDSASEIPRPALEAIVRAGGIDELVRSGGATRRITPSGRRQLVIRKNAAN